MDDNIRPIRPAPVDWFLPLEFGMGFNDIYRRKKKKLKPNKSHNSRRGIESSESLACCLTCRKVVHGRCWACRPFVGKIPESIDDPNDPTEEEIKERARRIRDEGYFQENPRFGSGYRPPWTELDYRIRAGEAIDPVEFDKIKHKDLFPKE